MSQQQEQVLFTQKLKGIIKKSWNYFNVENAMFFADILYSFSKCYPEIISTEEALVWLASSYMHANQLKRAYYLMLPYKDSFESLNGNYLLALISYRLNVAAENDDGHIAMMMNTLVSKMQALITKNSLNRSDYDKNGFYFPEAEIASEEVHHLIGLINKDRKKEFLSSFKASFDLFSDDYISWSCIENMINEGKQTNSYISTIFMFK